MNADRRFDMRLPESELAWWRTEADRRGWSMAVLVRKAVLEYVDSHPSPAPLPDEHAERVRAAREETAAWVKGLMG